MLSTDQIRERFLKSMEACGHSRLPSDNLVPQNDPTLLFTGAGMNQFKAQFNGIGITHPRVTTTQKCLRTGDIEEVGRTPRHHTFFEMLGFFSFGDYFKDQAIPQAWNFLTEGCGLDATRLWVTIYQDDDEAHDIWKTLIPESRIVRLGEDDNFWPAGAPSKGPNGPCGPCSEIHFDRGESFGPDDPAPGGASDRYLEVCNIVFTQYDRQDDGSLEPLPQKNIDFGMGLERLVAVVQGVESNFEIDLFVILQNKLEERLGLESVSADQIPALRRIMDHMRAVVFCVAEGVMPGPNSQGYVIRRLLRRAILDVHDLGVDRPVLNEFVTDVVDVMKGGFPEIVETRERVAGVVRAEEDSFRRTLRDGRGIVERHMESLKSAGSQVLDGAEAFDLYSTYGFPLELTRDLLEAEGIGIDLAGYEAAVTADRERSQKGSKITGDVFVESPAQTARKVVDETVFTGYERLKGQSVVRVLFGDTGRTESLSTGASGLLVVEETPFYAESGGQVGDRGWVTADGLKARITDTTKEAGIWLHHIVVDEGTLRESQTVALDVDEEARRRTEANHSATHLMNWALREVLGSGVAQAGSQVGPETLRFDFSHGAPLTAEEVARVEDLVNAAVWEASGTVCRLMSIDDARQSGATAMFGEKYADEVRVLTIGPSKELCGGTHVDNTGRIGLFRVTSQESVGSGVRRITAVTRDGALAWERRLESRLESAVQILKTQPDELPRRVESLVEDSAKMRKELQALQQAASAVAGGALVGEAVEINGLRVVLKGLAEGQDVLKVHDALKGQVDLAFLLAPQGGKVQLLVGLGDKALERGLKAGDLVKNVASCVDGRGGGKPHLARGSGSRVDGIAPALEKMAELIASC